MASSEEKETTSTGTLEISNVQEKLKDYDEDSSGGKEDKTDPTIKANREASEKNSQSTRVLLNAQDMLKESEKDEGEDEEIEFSAATSVFQLSDDMKKSLESGQSSEAQTVALDLNSYKADDEEIKKVKKKVKRHYIKKARVLEAEVNKILSGFKSSNPAVQKKIAKIQELLAKHSGRKKS